MNTHADKAQRKSVQPVAASITDKQSNRESTFQLIDNRSESAEQIKIQKVIDSGPHSKQLKTIQKLSANQTPPRVQRKESFLGPSQEKESTASLHAEVSQFKGGLLVDISKHVGSSAIQRQAIVQRIIVMADSEIDFGMIVNVYQMLINRIDRRVTLLSLLKNSDVRGEQIGLQGHGHGGKGLYAGRSAKWLADILKASGVGASNEVIDLLSCNSGSGGDASFAAEFAEEMGHAATIYANRGLGVTMDDGYVYSKRDRTPQEQQEYNQISVDCAAELAEAQKIAAIAKGEILKSTNEMEVKQLFLKYGAAILAVSGTLFGKLYVHQKKLLAPHNDPTSGLYVSPKK